MRELVEGVAGLIYALQIADPAQWVLRLAGFLGLVGAGLACLAWYPVLVWPVLLGGVVLAALWTGARPGSWAPFAGVAVVGLWWLAGGGDAAWWQTASVAGLLAVAHLGAAWAAAAPSYAAIPGRGVRRLVAWALGYLVACVVGIALVLAAGAVPGGLVPRGPAWVVLGLVAVVGSGVAVLALRGRGRR
ncbi:hypothetical protein LKO27_13655 [Tessaracoccus sp. OS52]|uniref:hypothetical protein n=1 Tax=Tessaracoccus sp. OS52 TaxID=2886691 RepID=UPI001D12BB6A|nr:hypothetical protein [Tessaracoccus sp. OS52]MCC2594450.1 hypothetical protein [Tessaracoccus sp. OS52]